VLRFVLASANRESGPLLSRMRIALVDEFGRWKRAETVLEAAWDRTAHLLGSTGGVVGAQRLSRTI